MQYVVLAGNYKEYINFLEESSLNRRDCKYANEISGILGMRKTDFILYGTYENNEIVKKWLSHVYICIIDHDGYGLYEYQDGKFFKRKIGFGRFNCYIDY